MLPTLDTVLGTSLKALVKSLQEFCKYATFAPSEYILFNTHCAFIKHIAHRLLRDASEIDSLLDSVGNVIFSRFSEAGDIRALSGYDDAAVLEAAVHAAMGVHAQQALLLLK